MKWRASFAGRKEITTPSCTFFITCDGFTRSVNPCQTIYSVSLRGVLHSQSPGLCWTPGVHNVTLGHTRHTHMPFSLPCLVSAGSRKLAAASISDPRKCLGSRSTIICIVVLHLNSYYGKMGHFVAVYIPPQSRPVRLVMSLSGGALPQGNAHKITDFVISSPHRHLKATLLIDINL